MAEDWSELPSELLVQISKRLLFIVDYVRFRSVCSSWRSSAPKRPQLPCLVGHRKDAGDPHTVLKFFTLLDGQIRPLALPESALGLRCLGSSHGWLALELDRFAILWNPLTGAKVRLPPYHHATRKLPASKLILSSDPAAPSPASDCFALATFGVEEGKVAFYRLEDGDVTLAFCRLGDDGWIPLETPPELAGLVIDPVCYRGRFYFAARNHIYAIDLGHSPMFARIPLANPPFDEYPCLFKTDASYLVESAGDLLVVLTHNSSLQFEDTWNPIARFEFEVYKVDWGVHKLKMFKVRSLGERVLFLGRGLSFSLPAEECPGWARNCIYLQDYLKIQCGQTRIRVLNFEDRSSKLIRNYQNWKPCAWVAPAM